MRRQRGGTWFLCISAVALSVNGMRAVSGQSGPVPTPAATAAVISGRTLFQEKGCVYCHGSAAQGTEKAPSLEAVGLHCKKADIARQIREGGEAMPAFGAVLSAAEEAELVEYLAGMRKSWR